MSEPFSPLEAQVYGTPELHSGSRIVKGKKKVSTE
jgi:hypothetical protein